LQNDPDMRFKEDFCNAVGAHPAGLSRWVKGTASPTLEHIAMLCIQFNANPTYLILGRGEMFGTKKADSGAINKIESRLIELENMVRNSQNKPGTKTRNKAVKTVKKRSVQK